MRWQRIEQKQLDAKEFANLEAKAHDIDHKSKSPFDFGVLTFRPEDVWEQNDVAYKHGTYVRGYRKRRLFELIDLINLDGKKVLDWGCGIGHHGTLFAMYGANADGFDLSPVAIERAREIARLNGVADLCEFRVANGTELPYDDDKFDMIVFNAVLHHAVKYENVAEEAYRVLKPGGMIYFAEGVRQNRLYRFLRSVKRALRPTDDLGDVDLEIEDLEKFCRKYEDFYYEQFSLIEKLATSVGRPYETRRIIRAFYFLSRKADDILFSICPSARSYGLEIVGRARKPARQAPQ